MTTQNKDRKKLIESLNLWHDRAVAFEGMNRQLEDQLKTMALQNAQLEQEAKDSEVRFARYVRKILDMLDK